MMKNEVASDKPHKYSNNHRHVREHVHSQQISSCFQPSVRSGSEADIDAAKIYAMAQDQDRRLSPAHRYLV